MPFQDVFDRRQAVPFRGGGTIMITIDLASGMYGFAAGVILATSVLVTAVLLEDMFRR